MALSTCKKRGPLSFGAVTQWKRKNIHSIKRSWRAPLQSNRQQHAYICLPHPATYCNHLQSLLSLHPPTPCTWSRQKPLCWVALSIPCKSLLWGSYPPSARTPLRYEATPWHGENISGNRRANYYLVKWCQVFWSNYLPSNQKLLFSWKCLPWRVTGEAKA